MKRTTRKILPIALVVLLVGAAGCAGWGTDGPAADGETNESETNESVSNETDTNQSDAATGDPSTDTDTGADTDTDESEAPAGGGNGDESETPSDDAPADSDDSSEPDAPDDSSDTEQPSTDDAPEAPADDEQDPEPEQPEQPPDDSEPEEPPEDKQPEEPEPEPEPEQPPEEPEQPEQPKEPEQPPEDEETYTLTVHTGEGVGAPDVPITVEGDGINETKTTNERGVTTFELPDGEYTVSGTDANDDTDSETVVIDGADEEVRLYALAPPVPDAHMLTVKVVDAETGEPIEGATVSGVGGFHPLTGDQLFQIVTGPDGTGSMEVLESHYTASVTAEGYEPDNPGITVEEDTTVTLELQPEASEEPPEEPEQPPGDEDTHTLTVEVINGETGEPIEANGEIGIGSPDHQATEPIKDGKSVFEDIPTGQYGISEDIPGHTTGSIPDHGVVVEGDTKYTLEVYPEPEEQTLTVTVVDAETGEPIEGAIVQGFGSNAAVYGDMLFAAETGEDGTTSAPIVEGQWSFEASADGYEFVQGIALTVDSDDELTIELQPERDVAYNEAVEPNETTENETAVAA